VDFLPLVNRVEAWRAKGCRRSGGGERCGDEPRRAAQVCSLQPVLRARCAAAQTPEALREAGVSEREQSDEPAAMALATGKPRLLPWAGKRPTRAGVAGGEPGPPAVPTAQARDLPRGVTRDDERATSTGASTCAARRRGGVTRDMEGPTASATGAYRAYERNGVTRGYGADDATADNAWAGPAGAQPIQPS
jgi:hypothetical protein